MKVILKEQLNNLGTLGQIVDVKRGYARNFLIPTGKVLRLNKENLEYFKTKKQELEQEEQSKLRMAKEMLSTFQKFSPYSLEVRSGEDGRLFGSILVKDVVNLLQKTTGLSIGKKIVQMPKKGFRELGSYPIVVSPYGNVFGEIIINIIGI